MTEYITDIDERRNRTDIEEEMEKRKSIKKDSINYVMKQERRDDNDDNERISDDNNGIR